MGTEYNAELTFAPKLNEASIKIVEKAATKWQSKVLKATEYKKSRERALVAEANAAFTFHPEMNSNSQRIINRRRKYEDHDVKPSDTDLSFETEAQCSSSPIDDTDQDQVSSSETEREDSFESASAHISQEAENFIQEVLSCTEEECGSIEKVESLTRDEARSKPMAAVPESPYKMPSRKILNLPYTNADYLYKIRAAKETALAAIREKRTFTILGPYPYLRKSLMRRGWVEKFGSHSAQPILGNPQPIRPKGPKKKKKVVSTSPKSSSESDDGSDDDSPANDPDFDRIVSRLLKDVSPTFIWTCKRDDIDFKYLHREQIVNHYCKASSFTTKIGLSQHLRSLQWFDNSNPNEFFPRCYQLYNEEDREDFREDFEMSAAMCLIKNFIKQYEAEQVKSSKSVPELQLDKDGIPIEEAENFLPLEALDLAVSHLLYVLKNNSHGFLDMPPTPDETPSNFKRKQLLNYSYKVTAKNFRFSSYPRPRYHQAQEILKEVIALELTQETIEGSTNTWIMKPGAKSRGRGIVPQNSFDECIKLADSSKEEKWVVQKYIEHPLLVHNTKFDIRQWFMVTDWNPLTLYFYQDSYLRFGSKPFTMSDFDPCIHLCNNSIQKKYINGSHGTTDTTFAQGNMWTNQAFKKFLVKKGKPTVWDEIIYPGMKKSIQRVMMTIQDVIEDRKNSFELYGADFMIDEHYIPWLIEINCSPAMGGTTKITERLCSDVLDDCVKVIIDKKENKNAPTGKWEVIYKQQIITVPPYIGVQLALEGKYLSKPSPPRRKKDSDADSDSKKSPKLTKPLVELPPRKASNKLEHKTSKIYGVCIGNEGFHPANVQCSDKACTSLICKQAEKYQKELIKSLSLNPPASTKLFGDPFVPNCAHQHNPNPNIHNGIRGDKPHTLREQQHAAAHRPPSSPPALHPHSVSHPQSTIGIITGPSPPQQQTLPSIIMSDLRAPNSPGHHCSLSISPISSIPTEDKWIIKKIHKNGRVSDLVPTNINPYRLQQIMGKQGRPKQLDMLTLQNKYSHGHNVNGVKILDIKTKKRKVRKINKIKSLTKLTSCPHCDPNNPKGIILNLLKDPSNQVSTSVSSKKEASNPRPKKHFRVSLSQVAQMSHKVVDIRKSGSHLKVVGEQPSN